MTTLSIQTQITINDVLEAAEQLPLAELEVLSRRLLQLQARRKASHLPQREAEIIEAIAQTGTSEHQSRLQALTQEMDKRSLTDDEQHELKELIALSESLTAKRLALLVELSQLRQVSLDALMKQLQIKAPPIV
jgi:hypothetical protein